MLPLAAILAGISITATAASWIYNNMTEKEKGRQVGLQNDLNDLKNKFDIRQNQHNENLNELARNNFNTIKRKFLEEVAFFKEEKKEIKNDLDKLAIAIERELKNEAISPYQRQSLLENRNRIEDAKNRLDAYWRYLDWFKHKLDNLAQYEKYEDILRLELPQPLLPEEYLYIGKLAYIIKNEISVNGDQSIGWNKYDQKLQLNDYHNKTEVDVLNSFDDSQEFMILIDFTKNNKHFNASAIKGILYQHILENMSFEVHPVRNERQNQERINVVYKDIRLLLKRDDKLYPFKRYKEYDSFEVKIKEFDLLLKEVFVTEKYNEIIKEISGGTIPCIFQINENIPIDCIEKIEISLQSNSFQAVSSSQNHLTLMLDKYELFFEIDKNNHLLVLHKIVSIDTSRLTSSSFTIPHEILLIENSLYYDRYKNFSLNQEVLFNEFISFLNDQFSYIDYSSKTEHKDFDFFRKWQRIIEYQIENNSFEIFKIQYIKYDRDDLILIFYIDSHTLKEHEIKIKDKKPKEVTLELNSINIGFLDDYSLNEGLLKSKIEFIDQLSDIPKCGTLLIKVKTHQPVLQKQKKALKDFASSKIVNNDIKQLLISPSLTQHKPLNCDCQLTFKNKNLTENQQEIIKKVFNEKNIFLVQGPPGTGKTTIIKELIYQTIKHDKYSKILIVSQQNVAVDNVLDGIDRENREWFAQEGYSIIRVAPNEDKIQYENIKKYTVENWFVKYKEAVIINFIHLEQNKNDNKNSFNSKLSTSFREINEQNIKLYEFAVKWLNLIYKPDFRDVDNEIKELLISKHQILGATCVGLANKSLGLDLVEFDTAIIDEAGRATAPELLIPILRAKKVILIGDHNQLPPTIDRKLLEKLDSDDENDLSFEDLEILKKSFFEELFEKIPLSNKAMLNEQFRMPQQIGSLTSSLFYDEKLRNGHIKETNDFICPKNIIKWIDVNGFHKKDGTSSYNNMEIDEIVTLLGLINSFLEKKGLIKSVGIITPYSAQKLRLKNKIKALNLFSKLNIKTDTVDSFQGEEADIVIYSTVKTYGNISFLLDRKRLNVAISRTKENLFFIGNKNFFYNAKTETTEVNLFKKIIDYLETSNIT
ncbi:AAA domain-containing protein [Desulfomicrobium baculatum]|uniref:AAA ATPase n=1 Tax=Desulfomicrobium baculatum (strain DSM 4028 / VKM B-1378 / X) TaxID=525897 RepID=C7LS07_DESBD|nr:AAA domain-containing protein [Desulfomicrobium baculatum]ACU89390.1 AAA ATPase [Desulfomicrobium baculatum DSM 4028]